MDLANLKAQLADLAGLLDQPSGPGSGAVVLDALTTIERLELRIDPAEPSTWSFTQV